MSEVVNYSELSFYELLELESAGKIKLSKLHNVIQDRTNNIRKWQLEDPTDDYEKYKQFIEVSKQQSIVLKTQLKEIKSCIKKASATNISLLSDFDWDCESFRALTLITNNTLEFENKIKALLTLFKIEGKNSHTINAKKYFRISNFPQISLHFSIKENNISIRLACDHNQDLIKVIDHLKLKVSKDSFRTKLTEQYQNEIMMLENIPTF